MPNSPLPPQCTTLPSNICRGRGRAIGSRPLLLWQCVQDLLRTRCRSSMQVPQILSSMPSNHGYAPSLIREKRRKNNKNEHSSLALPFFFICVWIGEIHWSRESMSHESAWIASSSFSRENYYSMLFSLLENTSDQNCNNTVVFRVIFQSEEWARSPIKDTLWKWAS